MLSSANYHYLNVVHVSFLAFIIIRINLTDNGDKLKAISYKQY
jgi:hypothetical protein